MFYKLVSVQYTHGYNIICNTIKIHYLTNCTETTTNSTYFIS